MLLELRSGRKEVRKGQRQMLIKTNVRGGLHWNIGDGSLRLALSLHIKIAIQSVNVGNRVSNTVVSTVTPFPILVPAR